MENPFCSPSFAAAHRLLGKATVTHRLATRLCRSSLRWPTYGGLIDRLRHRLEALELFFFVADRLGACLAAALAANNASLESRLREHREQEKELEEASRQLRRCPPLMQWWLSSNGSLLAYLISFALQLSLHFVMRDREEAE